MARITRPPQFSFDDSLVLLNRRQDPLTQTTRGNYEWTWAQAPLWHTVPGPSATPIYQKFTPTVRAGDVLSFLMFGADVPHLSFYFAEPANQQQYNQALTAYYTAINGVFTSLNLYFAGLTPIGPVIVPPQVPQAPAVCYTRQGQARRPGTLPPSWFTIGPVTDAGQGSLVSIAAPGGITLQGFPLLIDDLLCDPPPGEAGVAFDGITLTVGYESGLNHGFALSEDTGGDVNPQPAYTPIILRVDDYTAAIYNAGNVITQGDQLLIVVGLFQSEELP